AGVFLVIGGPAALRQACRRSRCGHREHACRALTRPDLPYQPARLLDEAGRVTSRTADTARPSRVADHLPLPAAAGARSTGTPPAPPAAGAPTAGSRPQPAGGGARRLSVRDAGRDPALGEGGAGRTPKG